MHSSPGLRDTTMRNTGSRSDGVSIPHQYVPASLSVRFSKVTVKVRSARWSLMDTWPFLTSLSAALVSTIFHTHRFLHQYLAFSLNLSSYRHCTLRDPPTVPAAELGPLRDEQPGRHSQVWVLTRWAWVKVTLESPKDPQGLEEALAGDRPFLRPKGGNKAPSSQSGTRRGCPWCVCVCVWALACLCV